MSRRSGVTCKPPHAWPDGRPTLASADDSAFYERIPMHAAHTYARMISS